MSPTTPPDKTELRKIVAVAGLTGEPSPIPLTRILEKVRHLIVDVQVEMFLCAEAEADRLHEKLAQLRDLEGRLTERLKG